MVRDTDFTWQFWRCCYCALDRELKYLIEFIPTVSNGQFSLLIKLNTTNTENNRIIKEGIFRKYYKLDSVKIDLPKEYKPFLEKFMDDYFEARDKRFIK